MAKTPEELKKEKALVAVMAASWVQPGMHLGIGSGTTVALFIQALGLRCCSEGFQISCVVASAASGKLAEAAGLKVSGFDIGLPLDLVVDGADEIDPQLDMIKGGGGALLRERIVARAGRHRLIIGDSSKPVQQLGRYPLPVEVVPFGADPAKASLEALVGIPVRRVVAGTTDPFVTDEGNWIFDCPFGAVASSSDLAAALSEVTALAAHGLFIGLADAALIADGADIFLLRPGAERVRLEPGAPSPFT